MTAVVVIQARTNSSRLPAKALLPVAGLPLAVLAAQRAANRGHQVIVATSTRPEDDALAAVVAQHDLAVFRGSLDDVLGRFVGAIGDCDDSTPVVRLTADNVFPDGRLIEQLEQAFEASQAGYLSCNNIDSGLPYGVSAEITRAGILREAASLAVDVSDREHVTPWVIRREDARAKFVPEPPVVMSHYRCTVDSLDDYLLVERIFRDLSDPVQAPLADLLQRLGSDHDRPVTATPVEKFVLGTVQLGIPYGIANSVGQPRVEDACAIVRTAIRSGVAELDTARAYGVSEAVLGQALRGGWRGRARLLTKLDPLADCPDDAPAPTVEAFVDASVFRSCRELGADRLDALMLHRAEHRIAWNGAAWQRLRQLRDEGAIGVLGISVQSPEQLAEAIDDPDVAHIQLPFNLLDGRWDALIPRIVSAKAKRQVIIHSRSALLQGLLATRDAGHWNRAGVAEPDAIWDWLDRAEHAGGWQDSADLCLAFVRAQPWIDGVVIGVETMDQLIANLAAFARPPMDEAECAALIRMRPPVADMVVDPARWNGNA